MPRNPSRCANATIAVFAMLFVALSAAPATAAAMGDHAARRPRLHHARAHPQVHRSPIVASGPALPYRPEYGFLSHVPPNAIRMPGYTFVPGVGILGASCDLPTSACSNQYRDIQ